MFSLAQKLTFQNPQNTSPPSARKPKSAILSGGIMSWIFESGNDYLFIFLAHLGLLAQCREQTTHLRISKNLVLLPDLSREKYRRKWKLTSIHQLRDALSAWEENANNETPWSVKCEVVQTPGLWEECQWIGEHQHPSLCIQATARRRMPKALGFSVFHFYLLGYWDWTLLWVLNGKISSHEISKRFKQLAQQTVFILLRRKSPSPPHTIW